MVNFPSKSTDKKEKKYDIPTLGSVENPEPENNIFRLNTQLNADIDKHINDLKQKGVKLEDTQGLLRKISKSSWARKVLAKALEEEGFRRD